MKKIKELSKKTKLIGSIAAGLVTTGITATIILLNATPVEAYVDSDTHYRDGEAYEDDYDFSDEPLKKGEKLTDVNGEEVIVSEPNQASASKQTMERISASEQELLIVTSGNAAEVISAANSDSPVALSKEAIVIVPCEDESPIVIEESTIEHEKIGEQNQISITVTEVPTYEELKSQAIQEQQAVIDAVKEAQKTSEIAEEKREKTVESVSNNSIENFVTEIENDVTLSDSTVSEDPQSYEEIPVFEEITSNEEVETFLF